MKKKNSKWIQAIRWILFLPASLISSLLSDALLRFLHNIMIINHNSWLDVIYKEIMCSGVLGVVFIYVGTLVAPKKKIVVAYVLTGFLLILSGMSLLACFLTQEYFSLINIVSINIASVITTISISRGEIDSILGNDTLEREAYTHK